MLLIREVSDSLLVWLCILSAVIRLWVTDSQSVHCYSHLGKICLLCIMSLLPSRFWWDHFHNDHSSRQMITHATTCTYRMLCCTNSGRHHAGMCTVVCPLEAGLLLRTDGLSLTLSTVAVSPTNAISCSSAWGERHPSVANSIWWRHIKVSSLFLFPSILWTLLQPSIRCSLHRMLGVCLSVCACAMGQLIPRWRFYLPYMEFMEFNMTYQST